jgi:heme exporter protein A
VTSRVDAVALTRTYGRRYALRKATFTLTSGAITAIIGRNGAGKTTAFNLLARRVSPSSGSVQFDGTPASSSEEHRRRVGFLSHSSFLYADLTARENLEVVRGLYGLEMSDFTPLLGRVGLGRAMDRPVRQFSRGMVQRLALGRILLTDPDVWLLDEPASGLDEAGRRWLQSELVSAREAGKVVALSSHSRALVASVATDVVVLEKGRVAHSAAVAGPEEMDALFEEHVG